MFCDKSQFEERLCGETKDFWIIATLGQISNGGYLLLVPKRHVECIGAMTSKEAKLLDKLGVRVCDALIQECGGTPDIIMFEHGIVGQTIKHAHLHIVPGVQIIAKRIADDFPENDVSCIVSLSDFRNSLYGKRKEPYLLWCDLRGMKVCWNPPAPLQYLRIIVADALGRPERANWRNMDPELDKKLWSETVKRLKPYFTSK